MAGSSWLFRVTRLALMIFMFTATIYPSATSAQITLQSSRLVVQAKPFPCITVFSPTGHSLVAIPYSSLSALSKALRLNWVPARVDTAVLYAVPIDLKRAHTLSPHALAIAQGVKNYFHAMRVLIVPIVLPTKEPVGVLQTREVLCLARDKPLSIDGVGSVEAGLLPQIRGDDSETLALLHIDAPFLKMGILYQTVRQPASQWPKDHGVLILQLSKVSERVSAKSLSVLDPDVAVLINDTGKDKLGAPLTQLIEQLYEMWVDVYEVKSGPPLVMTAGEHGLFLPSFGKHAHVRS